MITALHITGNQHLKLMSTSVIKIHYSRAVAMLMGIPIKTVRATNRTAAVTIFLQEPE